MLYGFFTFFSADSISKFKKLLNEKNKFQVSIVKEKDVVGLDEYIINEKYLFSVECISVDSEYFAIEKNVSN